MLKLCLAVATIAAASLSMVPTIASASPADGRPDADVVTASVPYADLNLTQPIGVSKLRQRIGFAARDVCGTPFSFEIIQNPERKLCINGAVASAQPAFDAAVAAARNGTVGITYGAALTVTAPKW